MESQIGVPAVVELLSSMANIGDSSTTLDVRRTAVLQVLMNLSSSRAGFWSWGRGNPRANTIVPLAMLDVGMTEQQKTCLIETSSSPQMRELFQLRVLEAAGALSADMENLQVTTLRQSLVPDESTHFFQQGISRCGWYEWVHSVRYSVYDTWSTLILFRETGQPQYSTLDACLIDAAMQGIPWLHVNSGEQFPTESMSLLTQRQRTVMLMLLDGQARKQIAHRLGLSEDTVNEHVRAIFTHFKVKSALELSAIFLRSK